MSRLPAHLDPHAVPDNVWCHECGTLVDGPAARDEQCPHRTVHTIEDVRCQRCCDCDECACLHDDPLGDERWQVPA